MIIKPKDINEAMDKYYKDLFKSDNERKDNAYGSINKPKGILEPDWLSMKNNIDARGVRERFYNMSFSILREVAKKVAPISAIHTLRTMQIRPFSQRSYNDEETGFKVKLKDFKSTPSRKDEKICEEIENFILNAGEINIPNTDDRDDIEDINEMIVRELLTIDQVAISLRYNRKGKLLDYWMLDGATIKRVAKDRGFEGDKEIKFVQEIDGRIIETFTYDDLVFYYSNKRTDINYRGYGYSYIEMCIDIITSWIFGMSYNREFFNSSSMPKGILSIDDADIQQGQLEELQREWVAMFRGIKGMWRTPFLKNAKYQSIGPSNRDMEFNEYIQVLSSWIFAIFGTDSQEVGMRFNQAQNVMNENNEAKIAYSKSRSLRHLLSCKAKIYNKIISRVPEWSDYYYTYTGLESKNQTELNTIDKDQVATYMTVNEKRAEKDMKPLPDDNGNIILNPQYIQMIQAKQAQSGESNQEDNEPALELNDSKLIEEDDIKKSKDDYIEIIL